MTFFNESTICILGLNSVSKRNSDLQVLLIVDKLSYNIKKFDVFLNEVFTSMTETTHK